MYGSCMYLLYFGGTQVECPRKLDGGGRRRRRKREAHDFFP